jgi:hypothetical protein
MEVHHHSHSSRKKWTHYFWEFLMLFLAVFCGFLAEYQLEHKIEKDREKQYMQSLLEDLSADTMMLNGNYRHAQNQKNLHDSILELLYYKQPLTSNAIAQLYKFHYSNRLVGVGFEDRTKAQLKNSGGMRLIRKKIINDSVLRYWKATESAEGIGDRITEAGNEVSNLAVRIFYTKYVISGDAALANPKGIRPEAMLINNDSKLLSEYANRLYTRRTRIMALQERMLTTKERATRLMELIKREYHLK